MPTEKTVDVHPVIAVRSSQSVLLEEFVENLKKTISKDQSKLLFESRHVDNTPFSEMIQEARTFPMFYEKKMVVVKGYDGFSKNDLKLLDNYASAPSSFCVLVLVSQGTRKTRTKTSKNIKMIDLDKGKVIDQEIARLAGKLGMKLTPGAVGFVKSMLGEDMNLIRNELEKISLYKGCEKSLDEDDLRGFVEKHSTENVFSLSTALSNRDLKRSMSILGELKKSREEPLSILYMIAWRFRQIFKASQLIQDGKSNNEIARALKTSPGAVYYIKKSAGNFIQTDIERVLALIEQTDYGIKNSSADSRVLIERLVLSICSEKTDSVYLRDSLRKQDYVRD